MRPPMTRVHASKHITIYRKVWDETSDKLVYGNNTSKGTLRVEEPVLAEMNVSCKQDKRVHIEGSRK